MRFALSAVLATAALTACAPVPQTTPAGGSADDPLGGTWRVYSIGGVQTEDIMATEMTFQGITSVSGSFGCNRFTGNYTYEGYLVYVTNVASSGPGCGGKTAWQESRGMRLLSMPMQVVPAANSVVLSGREGQSFTLVREGFIGQLTAQALPTR